MLVMIVMQVNLIQIPALSPNRNVKIVRSVRIKVVQVKIFVKIVLRGIFPAQLCLPVARCVQLVLILLLPRKRIAKNVQRVILNNLILCAKIVRKDTNNLLHQLNCVIFVLLGNMQLLFAK